MTRPAAGFALAAALLAAPLTPARQSDEPEFNGRKASAWAAVLKEDSSVRKRQAAVVALGQIWADFKYPPALPAVGKAVRNDPSPAVRARAAAVLGNLRRDDAKGALTDLTEALKAEKEPDVRKELVTSLGRFGELALPAVGPLTGALKDADPGTRAAAAEALGRVGREAASAAPDLLPMLKETDKALRQAAVFALGRVGTADTPAVGPALAGMAAGEKEPEVRRELVVALGLLGDKAEPVALALAGGLADADAETRQLACRSLAGFGSAVGPALAALLKAAAADPDKNVRIDAWRAVGNALGPGGMLAHIPLLADRLAADPDFEVRITVADELGALGPLPEDGPHRKDVAAALRKAQADAQVKVREAATAALRKVERKPEKPKDKADDKKP